jgi:hypothetical protein
VVVRLNRILLARYDAVKDDYPREKTLKSGVIVLRKGRR